MSTLKLKNHTFAASTCCILLFLVTAAFYDDTSSAVAKKNVSNTWKREKGLVFSKQYTNPDIVKLSDGRYRAYLMSPSYIASAISDDGRHFELEDGRRVEHASHMALVSLSNGSLRMYFTNTDPSRGETGVVMSAVSTDGLTFEVETGVRLRPGSSGSPDAAGLIHMSVVRDSSGYILFYDADRGSRGTAPDWRGIMSARSNDGLTWTKDKGFRIQTGMKNLKFATMVWSPFLEKKGSRYTLYFTAEPNNATRKHGGIYKATSSNGKTFKVSKKVVLGIDPAVKDIKQGPGGTTGLPQDPFIIRVGKERRMFVFQAQQGTLSAIQR